MKEVLGLVALTVLAAALAETQQQSLSLVRVTSHQAHDFHPRWSPDGQSIAFASLRGGQAGPWIVHLADLVVSRIPTERTGDMYLDWSPDGGVLVFDATEPAGLFAFHMEDEREVQLTTSGAQPSFSPDGSEIVFVSNRSGNLDIWTMSANGGDPKRVTTDPALDVHPRWSPDGSRIVFTSNRSGNFDIWIVSSSGGSPTQLTSHPAHDDVADWSPDGSYIAFMSDRAGNQDIWVVPAAGGTPVQYTFHAADDAYPCFSPDGKRIAFASRRSGSSDIWIMQHPRPDDH